MLDIASTVWTDRVAGTTLGPGRVLNINLTTNHNQKGKSKTMCGSPTGGIKQTSLDGSPFTLSFDHVGIQVRDAEVSARFYESFGFK